MFSKIDYERLEALTNTEELNEYIVEYFSNNTIDHVKYKKALSILTLTQKGLTLSEIMDITKMTVDEWNILVACLKTYLMKYRTFWKINNENFKKAIYRQILVKPAIS